jgi:hypothetical protein
LLTLDWLEGADSEAISDFIRDGHLVSLMRDVGLRIQLLDQPSETEWESRLKKDVRVCSGLRFNLALGVTKHTTSLAELYCCKSIDSRMGLSAMVKTNGIIIEWDSFCDESMSMSSEVSLMWEPSLPCITLSSKIGAVTNESHATEYK